MAEPVNHNPEDPETKLTRLELEHAVRALRVVRENYIEQKLQLMDRELTHGNGHVREAMLACENEIYLLTRIISKLWQRLISIT